MINGDHKIVKSKNYEKLKANPTKKEVISNQRNLKGESAVVAILSIIMYEVRYYTF